LGQPLLLPVELTLLLQLVWAGIFYLIHQALYEKVRRTVSFAGG
jgi:ABC-type uncharacterized transport system permease subunit